MKRLILAVTLATSSSMAHADMRADSNALFGHMQSAYTAGMACADLLSMGSMMAPMAKEHCDRYEAAADLIEDIGQRYIAAGRYDEFMDYLEQRVKRSRVDQMHMDLFQQTVPRVEALLGE